MNMFLIPANSKKSMKIFGLFYIFDLILLGAGIVLTFILITVLPIEEIFWSVIALLPVAITAFLVFPVPNYHNVLTFIMSAWTFFTTRKNFIWKGWCVLDEEETTKK